MKKAVSKIGMATLIAFSTTSITACTEEDFAVGATLVIGAILIGAVAASDSTDHGSGGDYHHDHGGRDRRDGGRHDGFRRYKLTLDQVSLGNLLIGETEIEATANHFQISKTAATKILLSLEAAKDKDYSQLAEIGIEQQDIAALVRGDNPSVSTLKTLGESLGLTLNESHRVIQQIKNDVRAYTAL